MIIKEKENDINHFVSAKKYFNSSPSDYINSLKELNQISFIKQNISVMHMKVLCFLMLSQYEEIIEYYYLNKKYFDSLIEKSDDNKQKNEIKKILSLGFFNFNTKQKAKKICPDIKEEYNYKIEKFEIELIRKKEENNNCGKIDSTRINSQKTLKNIKQELDKNMKIIKQNKSKELKNISSLLVEDLFKQVKTREDEKQFHTSDKNIQKSERNKGKNSSKSISSNVYHKLKNELSDINSIQKEDGNLITFEEKMKDSKNPEQKNEIEEIHNINKLNSNIIIYDNPNHENFDNNFNIYSNINNINNNNEINININNNTNNTDKINNINNNNINSGKRDKKKKDKNDLIDPPRKSCNVFSFINPIEFTLSPGDASFNNYSGSINGEDEDNIILNNQNKILVKVEIDDVTYFFKKNENSKNNNDNYEEYINIDFGEFRNKSKKRTLKIKNSKSLKLTMNRNKYKNLEDFERIERGSQATNNLHQSDWKKTTYYKTKFVLDNK